ncbi:MAG: hypothetical protein ACRYHQ_16090 [Janthinobacterium lividum]
MSDQPETTADLHADANPGGCWDWSCRVCHAPVGVEPTDRQVGKKLESKSAALEVRIDA